MLIDTHCHLDFAVFDVNRAQVIDRARAAGVSQFVIPSVTVDNFQTVLDLCAASQGFHPALGLHPCFRHDADSALTRLIQTLAVSRVVAIGEIGLDFRPGQPAVSQQQVLFEHQLKVAKSHDLPVLLHVVKAHDQVLKRLRAIRLPKGGIVHAFSGSEQQAGEYAKLGFKLGFGGAVTYERATRLQRLAAQLPLEWLVLETDAPDMPLAGHGKGPNEPSQVAAVAERIARLRGIAVTEVARVTSATAIALLGLRSLGGYS